MMSEGRLQTKVSRTIGSARREFAARLQEGWFATPDRNATLDARLILAHVLGIDPGGFPGKDGQLISETESVAASGLIERRRVGEPVARIIGEKEFWSLPFRLSPATMVPRPDTETLVGAALDYLSFVDRRDEPLRVLDLGTGSGCIVLALLSELPRATGLGVDRQDEALFTATDNARRLGLLDRVRFAAGDWATAVRGRFDVILANPPYVEEDALPGLPTEVIGFDPRVALAGGADGLDPYRAIIPDVPRLLATGGVAILEFGPRQSGMIGRIASSAGMNVEIRHDLAGRERCALLTLS